MLCAREPSAVARSGLLAAPKASQANGSVEKIAVAVDVRGQIERVLAGEPFGELGVAPLERLDDLQMVDDRARRPVVLRNRGATDRAHVQEQIVGRVLDQL